MAYGINIGFGVRYKSRFWLKLVCDINLSFGIYKSWFWYKGFNMQYKSMLWYTIKIQVLEYDINLGIGI